MVLMTGVCQKNGSGIILIHGKSTLSGSIAASFQNSSAFPQIPWAQRSIQNKRIQQS